jgi:hypothetical protein
MTRRRSPINQTRSLLYSGARMLGGNRNINKPRERDNFLKSYLTYAMRIENHSGGEAWSSVRR